MQKNKTKPTFLITSIPLPSSPTTQGYPKSNFYFPLSFQPSPFQALNPKVGMSLFLLSKPEVGCLFLPPSPRSPFTSLPLVVNDWGLANQNRKEKCIPSPLPI